ncbi:Gfo/Idh/MocA family protein [Agromyces larvae]|uniref:Gfo/Idh/MocA family oxidoreductase n=1 Tax=Agromyces larvae TaxID=2929802 RepID=A0ABY4BZQ5_9MICO|nr:Gfo/Idh/MocA family oxidoreductase [Agromyces larvae]UOE43667.1 Gfo/Idh/MocA family oxidoreductase [Agromyces larvae]
MSQPRSIRYALIGTGSRAQMYLGAITGAHADTARLVAWSDPNAGRLDWSEQVFADASLPVPARFDADRLGEAIAEHGIDRVIITSPDFTHAGYIVAALEGGADAVVEKPLTVDEAGVRAIAEAVERTGRDVVITFNYRYSPRNTALKELIASGEIGEVTSVHFEWVLDTAHGADYFRRWHREKQNSGGLLVHKSSHHFDLVNWWLDDRPTRVYASGGLRFYGAENARRRGLGARPARGTDDSPLRDAFSLDLRDDPVLRGLYYDQEHHDGYLRDRDVFDEGITIEDNLALVVDYAGGATMSYSLNAHSPWEGYTVAVNGTAGRAELTVVERGAVLVDGDGRPVVDPSARPDEVARESGRPVSERLVVQRQFGAAREVPIPNGEGGHGGGDAVLLRDVFAGAEADPLGRAATWHDGVRSMAVGLAGNRSLVTGQAVATADLAIGAALPLLG